jgi:hypothetical protein
LGDIGRSVELTRLTRRPFGVGHMLDKLGIAGVVGVLVLFGGIALIAWVNLLLAAGMAFVVAGLGLVVYGLVSNLLASFGMGGMV